MAYHIQVVQGCRWGAYYSPKPSALRVGGDACPASDLEQEGIGAVNDAN